MEIRGHRQCQDCGAQWSYYDTGSVACPDCGSVHSRGLDDERTLHTAGQVELDLTGARMALDDAPVHEVARRAKDACRSFVRRYGFVRAGRLQPLDDEFVAAQELLHVADVVSRSRSLDDREERHLLALLGGAEAGERPSAAEVPPTLRGARGLAVADSVEAYRSDLRQWLDGNPHPEVGEPLSRIRDHERRVEALGGDVDPETAERLLAAVRDVGTYLYGGDEGALESALERVDRLDERS